MCPRRTGSECRYIVVADEDRAVVNFVIETLLSDGHAVFQAYDGWSAVQLALGLKICDLVITNTRVGGKPGPELVAELRGHLPTLAILYLANEGQSGRDLEGRLPEDVPILHEPFTAKDLRSSVEPLLGPWPRRA